MFKMSEYSFIAGLIAIGVAIVVYVLAAALAMISRRRLVLAGAGAAGGSISLGTRTAGGLGAYGTILANLGTIFITLSLVLRAIVTGHGPFGNMYEFSIAFAWGILVVYAYFERRYHVRTLGLIALPVAFGMLLYALTIPSSVEPLVPALQNNLLLTLHVAVSIIAYGTFAISFGTAILYLIQGKRGIRGLPNRELLDEIGYKAVVLGYPFMTLTIVLGAVWADVAWGTYWGWDPKETASLVTWLIYGGYLHARVVRGWRGERAAWLLILGFAATLFTYFGNLFFGGLHSYSGLNND